MKNTTNLRQAARNAGELALRAAPVAVLALAGASPAFAGGLDGAKSTADSLLSDIQGIVPIIATAGLILAAVAYAFHWVQNKYIAQFAIGCIIVGAAAKWVPSLMGSGS